MRKTLWLSLALAALLIALVAGAQVGLRRHDLVVLAADLLARGASLARPLIGAASLAVWAYTRQRAAGFYALAMASAALSMLALLAGSLTAGQALIPLQPAGLALAAITWTPGVRRPVQRVLAGLAAALFVLHFIIFLAINQYGTPQPWAGSLQVLQTAFFATLASAAWTGYRQHAVQPLRWLSAQALCLGLFALIDTLSLFGTPALAFFPFPYYIVIVLTIVAAIGVLWSSAKHGRHGMMTHR